MLSITRAVIQVNKEEILIANSDLYVNTWRKNTQICVFKHLLRLFECLFIMLLYVFYARRTNNDISINQRYR